MVHRTVAISAVVFFAAAAARAQPQGNLAGVDRILSPTVVATWLAHQDEAGGAQLDLLVLWRGSPGWFLDGGASGGGGGGSVDRDGTIRLTSRINYGEVSLEVDFDPDRRLVGLGQEQMPLGDANVLLVDDVDTNPHMMTTRRVDPVIPDGRRIEVLLRTSAELLDYLQCDVVLPDPAAQAQMEFLCAQTLGQCDARLSNPALQAMLDASCIP